MVTIPILNFVCSFNLFVHALISSCLFSSSSSLFQWFGIPLKGSDWLSVCVYLYVEANRFARQLGSVYNGDIVV